jgi:23S rRNA (uridine2552-2'-O)-methyltransferase
MEINQRYNILRPGYKVIDLGSAPGGWAQVAVDKVNSTKEKPTVVCLDRNSMAEARNMCFFLILI